MYKEGISKRISLIRKDKCMTQEQLSEKTGIPKNSIYRYESATSVVPLDKAMVIADALGCTLDELACRSDYVCKS